MLVLVQDLWSAGLGETCSLLELRAACDGMVYFQTELAWKTSVPSSLLFFLFVCSACLVVSCCLWWAPVLLVSFLCCVLVVVKKSSGTVQYSTIPGWSYKGATEGSRVHRLSFFNFFFFRAATRHLFFVLFRHSSQYWHHAFILLIRTPCLSLLGITSPHVPFLLFVCPYLHEVLVLFHSLSFLLPEPCLSLLFVLVPACPSIVTFPCLSLRILFLILSSLSVALLIVPCRSLHLLSRTKPYPFLTLRIIALSYLCLS